MHHEITLSQVPTPVGELTVASTDGHIAICEFSDHKERVAKQLRRFYSGCTIQHGSLKTTIIQAFEAYFSGNTIALDSLETRPFGTAYEQTVWERLRRIPVGTTTSYGALAQELNSSARAVGRANGRNPVALIHPCHRVIGADGSLTGYAGGLKRKHWLLQHEGVLLPL